MIKINVITLFPELIEPHLKYLPFKKAINELEILEVNFVQLRDFAIDKHGTVDDKTYGGGVGLVLRPEPLFDALLSVGFSEEELLDGDLRAQNKPMHKIIVLTPKGEQYDQNTAKLLSEMEEITLISGRYEGIDQRILSLCDFQLSIGNFVLSGGEIPALVVMESVTRLLAGVLEKHEASAVESYSDPKASKKEFPQYTRPENYKGLVVPEILLSGDHKKIQEWRKSQQ